MEIATLEDFNELKIEVKQLKDGIQTLLRIQGAPPIDAKEIARRVGLSEKIIYSFENRVHLPNYGISEFSSGRMRWTLESYLDWISIDIETRRDNWINLPSREREKIVLKKKSRKISKNC